MAVFSALSLRSEGHPMSRPVVIMTAFLTSVTIMTAENYWMVWPGLAYEWAALIRPDVVRPPVWGIDFLATYLAYGVTGAAWGWAWCRWGHQGNSELKVR